MLSLNKLCELEDFSDPELRRVIRDIFRYEVRTLGEGFPTGFEFRKYWETAMAVRALSMADLLDGDSLLLGVGAGSEPAIFYLTNHARRVFATDLYFGRGWNAFANLRMLETPQRFWPSPWNPLRLVVQHMNALDLQYEDSSFDGIFSSSSIEHFGAVAEIRRSLEEMERVLRPGGVASISTEYLLSGNPREVRETLLFDERLLHNVVLDDSLWEVPESISLDLSKATRDSAVDYDRTRKEARKHVRRHGEILYHELRWSHYPHLVLRRGKTLWTSLHLSLRKRS